MKNPKCFCSSFVLVSLVTLAFAAAANTEKPDVVTVPLELRSPKTSDEILNEQLKEAILDDLRGWNVSCARRDSCKIDKDNKMSDAANWDDRNCMCDDACAQFGDCCPDARNFRLQQQQKAAALFTCHQFRQYKGLLVVAQCPANWSFQETRSLCEAEDNLADPLSMTPVTSNSTGFTYKNVYCALCNGEDFTSPRMDGGTLTFWKLRLECSIRAQDKRLSRLSNETAKELVSWDPVRQRWGAVLDLNDGQGSNFRECSFAPYMPEEVQLYMRPCVPVVDTCSPDWDDLEIEGKCSSYTSVLYKAPEIFRNAHCALCNRVDVKSLQCENDVLGRFLSNINFDFSSFALLFDVSSKDGGSIVGTRAVCKEGELYDLLSKKCRPVYCSEGQEYHEGICKNSSRKPEDHVVFPGEESTTNSSDVGGKHLLSSCTQFLLQKSEVKILSNGTLYVISYDKYYGADQYLLESDGTVKICAQGTTAVRKFDPALSWVTLVGLGISEVCFLIHLVAYVLTPELQTFSGHLLASFSVALFAAYGSFIAAQFLQTGSSLCFGAAVSICYFFLVAFWWSSVMAWDVWSTVHTATTKLRSPSGSPKVKFVLYSLYAWIVPALIVIAAALIDVLDVGAVLVVPAGLHPEFGKYVCWFGQREALLVYFAAPLTVIMAVNIFLFSWSTYMIVSATSNAASSNTKDSKKQLWLYCRLALIMGLSWITGLVAGAVDFGPLWYIFVALCTTQGLFILLAFTCKKKVLTSLKERLSCCCHRPEWQRASYGMAIVAGDDRDGKLLRRQALDNQDSHDAPSSQSRTSLIMLSQH